MKKEKNLIRFIFEQHNRLSCIIRYNNTPTLSGESVAEHSYYVAFLTMLVGDYLMNKGVVGLDKEKMMKMALVHDLEEIISGDIIKVLKSGEFKEVLQKLNVKSMRYLTGTMEEEGEAYYALWMEAKEKKTTEARIVDFVDMVTCAIYCVKEIHLGNKYFREILVYATNALQKMVGEISELTLFTNELRKYVTKFLVEDKGVVDGIESAVRIDLEKEKE